MRFALVVLLLLAGIVRAMAADSFADGVAAIAKGDFESAVKIFRPLAEKGDVASQYNMALAYAHGRGVARDDEAAVDWLERAAAADYARAEALLGLMVGIGRGTMVDAARSAALFDKAARHGDALGQYHLGQAYLAGRGVPKDEARAVALFRKAAAQGDVNGQVALAGVLADGTGTAVDLPEACYWLTLASRAMPEGRPRDLVVGLRALLAQKAGGTVLADAEKKADSFKPAPDPDAVPEGALAEPKPEEPKTDSKTDPGNGSGPEPQSEPRSKSESETAAKPGSGAPKP